MAGLDALAGGWLASHYGFRSVFIAISILRITGTIGITLISQEIRLAHPQPLDLAGSTTIIVASLSVIIILSLIQNLSNLKTIPLQDYAVGIVILAIVACISITLCVHSERKSKHPLLDGKVLLRPQVTFFLLQ